MAYSIETIPTEAYMPSAFTSDWVISLIHIQLFIYNSVTNIQGTGKWFFFLIFL